MGLAQGRLAQILLGVVLAAARKRDLAGVPAQIGAPLGEDGAQVGVERHQHCGVLGAGGVQRRGLLGRQEQLPHALIIGRP